LRHVRESLIDLGRSARRDARDPHRERLRRRVDLLRRCAWVGFAGFERMPIRERFGITS
jgi:hypothetical protein